MEREENHVDGPRREFMRACGQLVVGAVVVSVAAPMVEGCEISTVRPTNTPTDFDVSALTTDNQFTIPLDATGPEGAPLLIIRKSATDFTTLSMLCTHQGCTVNPPDGSIINCACHGSKYDLSGAVLKGPSVRPLRSYPTTYDPATGHVKVTYS